MICATSHITPNAVTESNNKHVFSHVLCGSGIEEWLRWAGLMWGLLRSDGGWGYLDVSTCLRLLGQEDSMRWGRNSWGSSASFSLPGLSTLAASG